MRVFKVKYWYGPNASVCPKGQKIYVIADSIAEAESKFLKDSQLKKLKLEYLTILSITLHPGTVLI